MTIATASSALTDIRQQRETESRATFEQLTARLADGKTLQPAEVERLDAALDRLNLSPTEADARVRELIRLAELTKAMRGYDKRMKEARAEYDAAAVDLELDAYVQRQDAFRAHETELKERFNNANRTIGELRKLSDEYAELKTKFEGGKA